MFKPQESSCSAWLPWTCGLWRARNVLFLHCSRSVVQWACMEGLDSRKPKRALRVFGCGGGNVRNEWNLFSSWVTASILSAVWMKVDGLWELWHWVVSVGGCEQFHLSEYSRNVCFLLVRSKMISKPVGYFWPSWYMLWQMIAFFRERVFDVLSVTANECFWIVEERGWFSTVHLWLCVWEYVGN